MGAYPVQHDSVFELLDEYYSSLQVGLVSTPSTLYSPPCCPPSPLFRALSCMLRCTTG